MNWSDGYVSGIDYTYGYFPDLNPLQAKLKLIYAGIKPPKIKTACELGFGQGISLLAHAASSDIDWYGNDFNPNHVAFASNLAQSVGLKLEPSDESFEAFCNRDDLPMFDFIGLHGIWSWVSEENRGYIKEFIKKKLNVGGLVYISYNTTTGRAPILPVRNLLLQHSELQSAPGSNMQDKISSASSFLQNLLKADPTFKKVNQHTTKSLENILQKNPEYLAHEYFNKDWCLMNFSEVSKILTDCKLSYAASANALDALPHVNFSEEQIALINSVSDIALKEDVKDFCINQEFRRDLWVKGSERLTNSERMQLIGDTAISLIKPAGEVSLILKNHLGEFTLSEEIYGPIITILSKNSSVKIRDVAKELNDKLTLAQIVEAVLILSSANDIQIAVDKSNSANKTHSKIYNAQLIEKAKTSSQVTALLSPVTGSCIAVNRTDQLFILAVQNKHNQPEELAQFVWNLIKPQGERIIKDDAPLETEEDNIAELISMAKEFLGSKIATYKRLKII